VRTNNRSFYLTKLDLNSGGGGIYVDAHNPDSEVLDPLEKTGAEAHSMGFSLKDECEAEVLSII